MITGRHLSKTPLLRLANGRRLALGILAISFCFVRFIAFLRGLRYDGDRLVQTFMQFPDIQLLKFQNLGSVLFDFHFTAPGFPMMYIVSHSLFKSFWWIAPYLIVILLGIFANLSMYRFLIERNFSNVASLTITLICLTANPALVLYEAQFYSTAFVTYLVVILFTTIASSSFILKNSVSRICIILLFLALIRSSFLAILVLPFVFILILIHLRVLNKQTLIKVIPISLISLLLTSALLGRYVKYEQLSFQSSAASGTLLGFSNIDGFKGFGYPDTTYFPFKEFLNDPSEIGDINQSKSKSNGLPNWNYDGYLDTYKRDNSNILRLMDENIALFPKFLANSIAWSSTNPACSRVILQENYKSVEFLDAKVRTVVLGRTSWNKTSSELTPCGGTSSYDLTFLGLLLIFFVSLCKYFFYLIRNRLQDKFTPFALGIVLLSIFASLMNGSPEASKYRVEYEAFMVLFVCWIYSMKSNRFANLNPKPNWRRNL
jgi:hypothetical protein